MTNTKLDSGLQVILSPVPGTKSITVMLMVGVGSRHEASDKAGLSHFVEHMVFKGTDKWPEALELSAAVDGIGAEFNAFTGKEYTGFYIKCTSNHLDFALDVLTDMIYTPKLRENDINREKGVIVEEINMYNDLPQRKVGDVFDALMYGADYGLGRRIDGTRDTVTKFTQADFKHHMSTWYGPNNTVLVIAGDAQLLADESAVLKLIDTYTVKGEGYSHTIAEKTLGFEEHTKPESRFDKRAGDQAHFVLGFPSFGLGDPRRYAQSLLQVVLGGNMSSRLFTQVREERGLAYYIRAEVDRYQDTGAFAAASGVDVNRLDEAVEVTLQVFADVAADGAKAITDTELARAKEYLAGSMILSLEDSQSVAQYWAQRVVAGDELLTPDEVLTRVRAVKRSELVAVARDIFVPERQVFALVGPKDRK